MRWLYVLVLLAYLTLPSFAEEERSACYSIQNKECNEDAFCNNTTQPYACTCKDGYVGTGYKCRDPKQFKAADAKFAVSFVINFILAVLFLCLFLYFRKKVPAVYEPRCHRATMIDGKLREEVEEDDNNLGESSNRRMNKDDNDEKSLPPAPPPSLFGWVMHTWRYGDEDIYRIHGLDAMMYLKVIKMMMYILIAFAVFGIVILFPVNATGENTLLPLYEDLYVEGLNRLSMSAVGAGSNRLIAHLFSIIFNSVVVYWFTYQLYRTYMLYRIRNRADIKKKQNFAVMVREIPVLSSNNNDADLVKYFEQLYPGQVVGVVRARTTVELWTKMAERNTNMRKVEHSWGVYNITGEKPTNKDKLFGGNVVDSIDWWTGKYDECTSSIARLQDEDHPSTGVAFVVFNNISASIQCSQVVLHAQNTYIPSNAPEPRDIQWQKLGVDHRSRFIRTLIVNIFIFFLIFFWAIPVTFVSGLSNLSTLAKAPGFGFLVKVIALNSVINGLIQGLLPTLAIIIFFAVLVMIIRAVANAQGIYTQSWLSRSVMSKYYAFQVFNIFLVYSIAGSIFGVIGTIAANPASVVSLLATSLPQQAVFFINYIMLLSLSKSTMALWRPGPLIVRWIKHKWLAKTDREYREAEAPGAYVYETAYTQHMLVFMVLCTYSTMAPFILIWGVIYFILNYLSAKYNIVHVHIPTFEGHGEHWPMVFNRMMVGLIIYQIVLIGVFSTYSFEAGTAISIICLIATIIFWHFTNKEFANTAKFGVLDVLNGTTRINTGEFDATEASGTEKSPSSVDAYAQPSLVKTSNAPRTVCTIIPQGKNTEMKAVRVASSKDMQ